MAYSSIAAIYDIHGNLPALEAVIAHIKTARVNAVVVGGDVLPGPLPNECLALLNSLDVPVHYIHGNGERAVLAVRAGEDSAEIPPRFKDVIRWVADQVTNEEAEFMRGWPLTTKLEVEGIGSVLFCHATLRNDTDIFTRLTPEKRLLPIFESADCALVVCGHTHMQFDRMIGETRVVNAGSVGMPFADPGAYWLLLGPGIRLQRTEYDLPGAAARIRHSSYPQADDFAENTILRPPSEEEMLERFAGVELK